MVGRLFLTLILWLSLVVLLSTASDTCPSEAAKPSYGRRLSDGTCLTLLEIDFNKFVDFNYSMVWLNSQCMNFKRGRHFYSYDIPSVDVMKMSSNNPVFIGYLILETYVENKENKLVTYMQWNESYAHKDRVHRNHHTVVLFNNVAWDPVLLKGVYPKCPFHGYNIHPKSMENIFVCSEVTTKLGKSNVFINCAHKAYTDCEMSTHDVCVKWTSGGGKEEYAMGYPFVKVQSESPYGKPCPAHKRGRNCQQACHGDWSAWIKDGPALCSYNRQERFERYAPKESGQPQCTADKKLQCCIEIKEQIGGIDCSEFDQTLTHHLKPDMCVHGKLEKKNGHNKCVCESLWAGVFCNESVCPGTCYNGGTCIPKGKDFTCRCVIGYTGKQCEKMDDSGPDGKPCNNHIQVRHDFVDGKSQPVCVCSEGFGGKWCEYKTDYCKPASCSGHGVCHNLTEERKHKCVCDKGYVGIACQQQQTVTGSVLDFFTGKSKPWLYLIVGFSMTLILFSGGTTIVAHHRRRRLRRRGGGGGGVTDSAVSGIGSTIFSTKGGTSTAASRRR